MRVILKCVKRGEGDAVDVESDVGDFAGIEVNVLGRIACRKKMDIGT